jgi:hypothetical protein
MCILSKVAIVIGIEIFLTFVFHFLTPKSLKKRGIDYTSIGKGILERIFLTIGLISALPHTLTLFGALKLGTRLKKTENNLKEESKYNSYYLIGNFISVLISILYYNIFK